VALLLALEKAGQDSKAFAISPFTGVSDMVSGFGIRVLERRDAAAAQLFYAMGKGFKEILMSLR